MNENAKLVVQPQGAIFVSTFSRAAELDDCLRNIVAARGNLDIPLIVIHQIGSSLVAEVIERWRSEIQVLVQTINTGTSALQSINLNGLLGREIAFTWLAAEWCVGVEDDVLISKDSLKLCMFLFKKHHKDPFFRGVNLGSKRPFDPAFNDKYSKVIFGIHGQASLITRRTWKKFNPDKLRRLSSIEGQDAVMEHFIKTGYMCTPCNSRYLDRGWNGTHAPKDPNHSHYVDLQNSYYSGEPQFDEYLEVPYDSFWREDSVPFSVSSVIPIFLKNKALRLRYKLRKAFSR